MNRSIKMATLAALCLPLMAHAHKVWLLPSSTVSTVDQWVTVDAAVSNDLFYFNHVPLGVENLQITAPDGRSVKAENVATGKYRTTFDLHLVQNGTYRIATVDGGLSASYEQNGAPKRWRGTAQEFATGIPADAKNLKVAESLGRIETFVTAGKPTSVALKPSNRGLELAPVTHPNDLYAGETAKFALLVDGKPAVNQAVLIMAGGTRYRDQPQEIKATTDAAGQFSVTWPDPGMYWIEVERQDSKTSVKQAQQRSLSYAATFEVLPQ